MDKAGSDMERQGALHPEPALVNRHRGNKSPNFSGSHFPNLLHEWCGPAISKFPAASIIPWGISLWLLRKKALNLLQWPLCPQDQPSLTGLQTKLTSAFYLPHQWEPPKVSLDFFLLVICWYPTLTGSLNSIILLEVSAKLSPKSLYTGADRNYQLSSSWRCTFFHIITSLKLRVPLLTLSEHLTFYVLYIRSLLKASKQPLEYYYLSRFMDEENKVQRSWKTHLRSHRTREGSVWPEWLCPQIHMLKPNNQWDGFRRWDC